MSGANSKSTKSQTTPWSCPQKHSLRLSADPKVSFTAIKWFVSVFRQRSPAPLDPTLFCCRSGRCAGQERNVIRITVRNHVGQQIENLIFLQSVQNSSGHIRDLRQFAPADVAFAEGGGLGGRRLG